MGRLLTILLLFALVLHNNAASADNVAQGVKVIVNITLDEIKSILIPSKYIGRCVEQVERFLANDVDPYLENMDEAVKAELSV